MSNERKTILIKPEDFKIQSTSKTRKKRDPNDTPPPKLRIKSEKTKMNKTTKNQVLKYIRQQQEQKYKKLLESNTQSAGTSSVTVPSPSLVDDFNSDFKESLNFLNTISENVKVSPNLQSTLKYRPPSIINATPLQGGQTTNTHSELEMVHLDTPNVFTNHTSVPLPQPKYGCLKGGVLPTYRQFNKTHKNYQTGSNQLSMNIPPLNPDQMHMQSNTSIQPLENVNPDVQSGSSVSSFLEDTKTQELLNKFKSPSFMKPKREIQSFAKKKEEIKAGQSKPKFKKIKQKKTMRRTFRLGKSKHYPRVAVLVSNRTLRKQISSRAQELKQVPIEEVKKTLIKKGFIKVGSIAPPDVLRKMYESVSLICGEVQNHNPDNLIYNYFNSEH